MWYITKKDIANYRIAPGEPISHQVWNDRDDLRRYEYEAWIRWLVGYGVDTDKPVTCSIVEVDQEKKKKMLKFSVGQTEHFRLFIYGTYIVLTNGAALPLLDLSTNKDSGKEKYLYIFSFEYQRPVSEPWKEPRGQSIGSQHWRSYRKWLGIEDNLDIQEAKKRVPNIGYADRLMRNFACAMIPEKTYQIDEKAEDIKKFLLQQLTSQETKEQFPQLLEKDYQKDTLTISDCHARLGKIDLNNQFIFERPLEKLPRVIFSPRDPPTLITYPEEIAVRMTKGCLVNPVDWNLTDKFRRVEQEKFLWWLLNGQDGLISQDSENTKQLCSCKMSTIKELDDLDNDVTKRMTLIWRKMAQNTTFSTNEACYENWPKSSYSIITSQVLKVLSESTATNQIAIHFWDGTTIQTWQLSISSNELSKMEKEYSITREPLDYIKQITSSLANEILSGVPITHIDFNSMDDIRKFQHKRIVFAVAGNKELEEQKITINHPSQIWCQSNYKTYKAFYAKRGIIYYPEGGDELYIQNDCIVFYNSPEFGLPISAIAQAAQAILLGSQNDENIYIKVDDIIYYIRKNFLSTMATIENEKLSTYTYYLIPYYFQ